MRPKTNAPLKSKGADSETKVVIPAKIKVTIKALFLSGRKLTAKEINQITGSNDARKVISDLRREGMNIVDMVLPNGCKLYWLAEDVKQGKLFPEEVGCHEE